MSTVWKQMTKKEQWQALFPINPMKTYEASGSFMKKLTAASVSTIAYERGMYAKGCFERHRLFDNYVMTLKPRSGDPAAEFLARSIDDALQAFDKKFLRKLVLSLYAEKEDTVLESYYYNFKYKTNSEADGNQLEQNSNLDERMRSALDSLQQATKRTLELARKSASIEPALPDNYQVVIRLFYVEDAPEDYQPPGYMPGDKRDEEFGGCGDGDESSMLRLGEVITTHHKLSVKKFSVATTVGGVQRLQRAATSVTPAAPAPAATADAPATAADPRTPGSVNTTRTSRSSMLEMDVRCPCVGVVVTDTDCTLGSTLIACQDCQKYQHMACFGLSPNDATVLAAGDGGHYCEMCARRDPALVCSDPALVHMDREKAEALCIFRRTLEYCTRTRSLAGELLQAAFFLSRDVTFKILERLRHLGVLEPLAAGAPFTLSTHVAVNRTAALKRMPKYFKSSERPGVSLSDQLLQQYRLSSQESTGDADMEALLSPSGAGGGSSWGAAVRNVSSAPRPADGGAELFRAALPPPPPSSPPPPVPMEQDAPPPPPPPPTGGRCSTKRRAQAPAPPAAARTKRARKNVSKI